ncbi:MAG: hypothetical protein UV92_C0004G0033 [Parcubacteria group bacterium GW2011_GWA1_43_27]|nr:MAG: hypothetical protein UV92_C0004G0033 [Parcubacteria group bacterium GW2011_GWA1_43_27]HCM45705.1 hypothetical protein [Candidatus Veblenbacteria bacterium]
MTQRKSRLFFILIMLAFLASSFWPSAPLAAQTNFAYNYIISDYDLTDYQSMDLNQIQSFLVSKSSSLANYSDPITRLSAAQVIYQSAQDFQISPKFLLALIQKEQSLVEDGTPLPSQYDWATGYAVCDSCSTDDPLIQKFKGFYNQVYNAAKRISTVYLVELESNGQTSSGFGPGIAKQVDGLIVTPANKATAALYTYTPHLHGNELFSQVWERFFAQNYPDGTLLNVEGEREVWLIENGFRRAFANKSVYLSRYSDFDRVLSVSQTDLLKYPLGLEIKFSNYSYLKIPSGTVYLLVDDELRGFASAEALRRIGVNPEEIINVTETDLKDYHEGQPITINSLYPLGALLQDKTSGGVYWVQDGIKRPIWSREIMQVNFANRKIIAKSAADLAGYTTGEPVLFRDGELVRSADEPAVYLISNGERRPFRSAEDFLALGFDWQSVIVTTPVALALHDLGEPVIANF